MANRDIIDAEHQVSVSLPAAAANVNSPSIDLGFGSGRIEDVELEIDIDATLTLVETKDIDVHIEDSADDSSFANVAEFVDPIVKVVGASGDVSSRVRLQVRLPRTARRHVRINVAVETAGGDVTAHEAHLRLLF